MRTLFTLLLLASPVSAQLIWHLEENVSPPPDMLADAVNAYDSRRGRVVAFGDMEPSQVRRPETWEWDGRDWQLIPAPNAPNDNDNNGGAAMCFDAARGVSVYFGTDGTTHTWDGVVWRQVSTTGPGRRKSHRMAFDPVRNEVVLFGGLTLGSNSQFLDVPWVWDGTTWSPRPTGPRGRRFHAMGWDPVRRSILVLGGQNPFSPITGDFWEWNGTSWTQLASSTPIGAVVQGDELVTDPVGARVVLHMSSLQTAHGIPTWVWDGASWNPVLDSVRAAPWSFFLQWDGRRFVSFSSRNVTGTWTLSNSVLIGGAGCAGATLSARGTPRIGAGITLDLASLPPGANVATLVFGASDRATGGLALPLDLGPLGAAGCALRASIDATVGVTAAGGAASFGLTIPNDPILQGERVHVQGIGVAPGVNALGAVTTNALELTIY